MLMNLCTLRSVHDVKIIMVKESILHGTGVVLGRYICDGPIPLLHRFSGTAVFCKLLENTIIRTESPGMKTGQHCIASVLLLSALQMSSAVQCPTGTVRVVNGELAFPKVSQVNFSMIPESSSGMLGGWYAMAGDFVDAVRPGGLPYCEAGAFTRLNI